MNIKDAPNYEIYQMVINRLGTMIYNISGSAQNQSEMETLIQEVIESAYRDGFTEGSKNAVDNHFQGLINKFK